MENNNMRYYEQGRSVPKNAQKAFSNGRFSGTDINPMWRIKKLTEMFGPAGIGWYTEITRQDFIPVDDGNVMVFVDLNLYVKDGDTWSKPIFGTGGNTLKTKGKGDDDGFKKAYTDALSIACKALGIGADIWYGADVNNDPTSKYADRYSDNPPAQGTAEAAKAVGEQKLQEMEKKLADIKGNDQQTVPACERCGKVITGWVDGNGNRYTASAIIKRAQEKYKGCYCANCMTEIAANSRKKVS